MSRGAPKVSVVIPHYQDLAGLALCLDSLERQTFSRDEFEIIVADNVSPAGEAAVAKVIAGRAKLVVCAERGAGPNRNAGVAATCGEVLAFIDSDCQAEPQWLANGLAGLANFDFIGGRVKVLVDDPAQMTAAEAFEAVFAFDFDTYINKKGFTGAGNLICPRKLFDAVGGFSNGVSEDVEWSHRATGKGYRLGYVPDAIVGHPARRTWAELKGKWARVNAETYRLHMQNRRGLVAWLGRCAALPASALVHTPKVLLSDSLPGVRERVLAIAMLYRLRFWRAFHSTQLALGGAPRP
ncbi:MAG TPA: glycosyltransferase [Phenylobacterium sp.]